MVKQMFRVPNMHCSGCAMILEGIEDEIPGIKRIDASYKKQQMAVEYDESRVSTAQIIAAAKQHGYDAVPT
jgi:Cu2+-exporting ATPase/Cu+-exporting ATPase